MRIILRSAAFAAAGCLMLCVMAVAGYVASQWGWGYYMNAAYRQIEVGDRADRVIYALGIPESVDAVSYRGRQSTPGLVIRYRFLPGGSLAAKMNWTFRIDLSGRVTWKYFSDGC